jgi:hypothetical protein
MRRGEDEERRREERRGETRGEERRGEEKREDEERRRKEKRGVEKRGEERREERREEKRTRRDERRGEKRRGEEEENRSWFYCEINTDVQQRETSDDQFYFTSYILVPCITLPFMFDTNARTRCRFWLRTSAYDAV